MLSTSCNVLVLTEELRTVSAIDATLGSDGFVQVMPACRNMQELVGRLEQDKASAALVDLDRHPQRTLAELEPVIARFSDTRFIVLSDSLREDLMFEALQMGARHFLVKDSIESDLQPALERLVPASRTATAVADGIGSVITVLGVSGGCGVTTVAVNLANELALATSSNALLVDLDAGYGMVATYLGLEGRYGIADVLTDAGRIDADLIHSTAAVYRDNLHVLLSPASTKGLRPASLVFDHLDLVVEACTRGYSHVVIDAPRIPLEVAAGLVNASAVTLLVLQPTVKDVRFAQAILAGLTDLGSAVDRVTPLVNRYQNRKTVVTLDEVQDALATQSVEYLRNDYRAGIVSLNQAQPLARAARRSLLRRDLRRMAEAISDRYPHSKEEKRVDHHECANRLPGPRRDARPRRWMANGAALGAAAVVGAVLLAYGQAGAPPEKAYIRTDALAAAGRPSADHAPYRWTEQAEAPLPSLEMTGNQAPSREQLDRGRSRVNHRRAHLPHLRLSDWQTASQDDRLSTAIDFVVAEMNRRSVTPSSMDEVQRQATTLQECISETGRGSDESELRIAEAAAACQAPPGG
jgi:pilus assembly protein CpaE